MRTIVIQATMLSSMYLLLTAEERAELRALERDVEFRVREMERLAVTRAGVPGPTTGTRYVDIGRAAALLNVSPRTVQYWLKNGRLKSKKQGQSRLVELSYDETQWPRRYKR